MKDIVLKTISVIFVLLITVAIAYGGWLLKRKINYSMNYQNKVIETCQKQNKPLLDRIKVLEKEVKILKGNINVHSN